MTRFEFWWLKKRYGAECPPLVMTELLISMYGFELKSVDYVITRAMCRYANEKVVVYPRPLKEPPGDGKIYGTSGDGCMIVDDPWQRCLECKGRGCVGLRKCPRCDGNGYHLHS